MKKGNIALEINAEVVQGPRGLSIKELKYKETLSNGDNVYSVIREDNNIIGEITAKKGDKGNTGEKGDTGRGITSVTKKSEIDEINYYEILYTDGTTEEFTVEDGYNAYQVAVRNGYEGTEEEWLLSLIGKGLEFQWNGTKLGVRVEGETEYQYSDDLKGDIPTNIKKVREETDGVVFAMVYPDGTELEFKIPYAEGVEGTTGFIAGDIMVQYLRRPVEENFIGYNNWKNLLYNEYKDLGTNIGAAWQKWTKLMVDDTNVIYESYSFNAGFGGGGTKRAGDANLKNAVLGIMREPTNSYSWTNPYYQAIDNNGNIANNQLFITFSGTTIWEILTANKPVLIVLELEFYGQRFYYDTNGNSNSVYNIPEIIFGTYDYAIGQGHTNLTGKVKLTPLDNYSWPNSQDATWMNGFYLFNSLAWDKSELNNNVYSQSKEKEISRLGISISLPSNIQYITFKKFNLFTVETSTSDLYVKLPPTYFFPNYQNVTIPDYSGDGGVAHMDIALQRGIKVYLGKKEGV